MSNVFFFSLTGKRYRCFLSSLFTSHCLLPRIVVQHTSRSAFGREAITLEQHIQTSSFASAHCSSDPNFMKNITMERGQRILKMEKRYSCATCPEHPNAAENLSVSTVLQCLFRHCTHLTRFSKYI